MDTDIEKIKEEMDRCIRNVNYICKLIDNYKLNNELYVLDFYDTLNEISVRL